MYKVLQGDSLEVLRTLPDESVDCCVTSPPYWGLRDYGVAGQIGLEPTPDEFVSRLVDVFREVRRVLKSGGTCWVNLGDSYAGSGPSGASYQSKSTIGRKNRRFDGSFAISKTLASRGLTYAEKKPIPPVGLKSKDLCGIPWRVAFALQADGWWLRQDIIWHKPNPMPESVRDRCTKAHEYVFLLTKAERYFWDADSIRVPHKRLWDESNGGNMADAGHKKAGKFETKNTHPKGYPMPNPLGANCRSVWTVATQATPEAHFATFPLELPEMCLRAGCPVGGTVLDPFNGAGTTGLAALKNGRDYIGIELNPAYIEITHQRFQRHMPLLAMAEGGNDGASA